MTRQRCPRPWSRCLHRTVRASGAQRQPQNSQSSHQNPCTDPIHHARPYTECPGPTQGMNCQLALLPNRICYTFERGRVTDRQRGVNLVHLVYLVRTFNQTNETNQTNQSNQPTRSPAMPRPLVVTCTLIFILLCGKPPSVPAAAIIELPVLAAIQQNNLGVFEILMMWWDRKSEPNPVQLQWLLAGVRLGNDHLGAMAQAFAYAVERTPSIQHNGTVSVQGVAYRPTGSDGPSAGAA